jgi:pyruvyltransferase
MWKVFPRTFRKRARALFQQALHPALISAYWHINDVNWGDAINPALIHYLSGRTARYSDDPFTNKQMVVGSILHLADRYTTVWGAGFIAEGLKTREKPRAIHAVRGPLTRNQLHKNGIEAPEVYGDPALLLPFFYNPEVQKRYDVGIVAHYIDKDNPWLRKYCHDPKILLIDVQGDQRSFVQSIKSCNLVISSSLHGVICADAYGVPSLWVEFSGKVVGGGFKFFDYLQSVQREPFPPQRITEEDSLTRVLAKHKDYTIQINKSRLIHACPFLSSGVRRSWRE